MAPRATLRPSAAPRLNTSGSLFAACRRVSVGMWVYCLETVGELWLMNSCAPASDTPADLSNVVAVCRSE